MAMESMGSQRVGFTSCKLWSCHFTWPVLQDSVHQRPDRVDEIIKNLRKELKSEPQVRRHQKQNLLGFCLYQKEDKDGAALKVFEDILNENMENLNALKNLAFVLNDLGGSERRVHEITLKVKQLLTVTNDNWIGRVNARKAEQLAEEASAYGTFDQHQRPDSTLAMRLRWLALEIGKEADRFKYNEWRYGLAFDLGRLDNKYITEKKVNTEVYFEDAAKLCYDVVQEKVASDDSDFKLMQAKVWFFLGDLANRKKNRSLKNVLGLDKEPDCYVNALMTKGDHPLVQRTVAERKRQRKEYSEALQQFSDSIEKEDMWWARHRRGKTYLEKYEENKIAGDLNRAIEDFKMAIEMYSMHYVCVDLAKALMCRGKNNGSAEDLQKAIYLCLDVGLKGGADSCKDHWSEVMKEALSSLGKLGVKQVNLSVLNPENISVEPESKKTRVKHENVGGACNNSKLKDPDRTQLDCLVIYSNTSDFSQQVFSKLNDFESLEWKRWPHENDEQTIEDAIGNSKKVMVVITEDLSNSPWFRKALECNEMQTRLDEHCVLPIVPYLETPIPVEFRDEFSLKENIDGIFWNRILEFLNLPPPPVPEEFMTEAIRLVAREAETLANVINLCRELKLKEGRINAVIDDHREIGSDEVKYKLLHLWLSKEGEKATLQILIDGLETLNLGALAYKVKCKFSQYL